jgi:hypothetical protein
MLQRAESEPTDSLSDALLPDVPRWLLESYLVGLRLDDAPWETAVPADAGLSAETDVFLKESRGWLDPGPLTLRTSGGERESADLRLVLGKGERWHLAKFDAVASLGSTDAKVTAYGQLAYIPPDGRGLALTLDESRDPAAVGIKGQLGGFEIGAEYRSLGKRLERVLRVPQKDQEGSEVWLAQQLGNFRLRLSESKLSDNVDRSPALPRTTKAQTAVTVEVTPPAWPVFGLTYATGDSRRVWFTPGARGPEQQAFQSLTAASYYGGARWDVTASSTYALSRDSVKSDQQTASLYHTVSLSLRPLSSFTISPSIGAGEDRYLRSAATSGTGSASLMVSVDPPASRWHAWTVAAYTKNRISDNSVNGRGMSVTGGLGYDLGRLIRGRATLSVEAGYDRYADDVSPGNSLRAVFGFLLFKVAPF